MEEKRDIQVLVTHSVRVMWQNDVGRRDGLSGFLTA